MKRLSGLSIQGRCFQKETPLVFYAKTDERLSLVYGSNGSGKSTVSRAFSALTSSDESDIKATLLTFDGIPMPTPCITVFNEDYIDANVKIDDAGLGSIVLFGEQVELEAQITEAQNQVACEAAKLESLTTALEPFQDSKNISSPQFHWEKIKTILKGVSQWAQIDSRLKGNRQNSAVTDAIVHEICEMDVSIPLERLKAEFEEKQQLLAKMTDLNPAFLTPIRQLSLAPQFEDNLIRLLATEIAEPMLTDREQLILQLIQKGHQHDIEKAQTYFSETATDFCPYCFQSISKDYIQDLLGSINKVFNKDVDHHKAQLTAIVFQEIPNIYDHYSELDAQTVGHIRQLITEYNEVLTAYKEALQKKLHRIYTPIIQTKLGLELKLFEINSALLTLEHARTEFIAAANKRNSMIRELIRLNKQIAAHFCREEYSAYRAQLSEKQKLQKLYEEQKTQATDAQLHLEKLSAKRKNLLFAINCINESLAYVFFDSERLKIELRGEKYYLKSRGKDVKPKNVSIGERNIIALCYFFLQSTANRELTKRYEQEQFIVIDDPISSFDFDNKVGIISFLRREIKKIIFGNNSSKVLVLTHDLSTMFDLKKAYDEIGEEAKEIASVDKASSSWLELSNGMIKPFSNKRSEYAQLIESVYRYAVGDSSGQMTIGNQMRRLLEAFSSFCYRQSIEKVSCNKAILSQLDGYADYFENRMYRLILHGESHYLEQVYNFHDSLGFYEFFSETEKRATARDILCFMYLLNKQHIKAYLPQANKELERWCADIQCQVSRSTIEQNGTTQTDQIATKKVKLFDIPLSAGCGIDMFETDDNGTDFEVTEDNCDFALRIKGDSMEPQIPNGSIVLIHKQETIETGEIGAFFHNGTVYCKKRGTNEGKTLLISNNPKYEPIEVVEDDVSKCYGKVISILSPAKLLSPSEQ